MKPIKNPLEVYRLLPQTNCGRCYVPTCLAFAAAVIRGERRLADCPCLESTGTSGDAAMVDIREHPDRQREEMLASLKKQITKIDLSAAAQRLGAAYGEDRLTVKCLGKNFHVDGQGGVSSDCHTHAGLAIPLLSYILFSKGSAPAGRWVHFRELQNGRPMSALFERRGERALRQLADTHTDLFEDLISTFAGERSVNDFSSDISVVLYPLPKLPILICYWKPEDDLESDLNIFFDSSASDHLSIESIFELGVGLVMMFGRIVLKHA